MVKRQSGVVSPLLMPRCFSQAAMICSEPLSWQGVVPQIWRWNLPTFSRLNMVQKEATSQTSISFTSVILATFLIAERERKLLFCFWARVSRGMMADRFQVGGYLARILLTSLQFSLVNSKGVESLFSLVALWEKYPPENENTFFCNNCLLNFCSINQQIYLREDPSHSQHLFLRLLLHLYILFPMPPKKVQPPKEQPKPDPKKANNDKLAASKELPKKGAKETVEKDAKNNKSIEKKEVGKDNKDSKAIDKKDANKQPDKKEKVDPKDPKNKNEPTKNDKKDQKSLEKEKSLNPKDKNNKSIEKLDPKDKNNKSVEKIDIKDKNNKNNKSTDKIDPKKKVEEKDTKGGKKDGKDMNKSQQKDPKNKNDKNKNEKDAKNDKSKQKDTKNGKNNAKEEKAPSPKKNDNKSLQKINPNGKNAKPQPPKPKAEQDIIKDSGLLQAYELFLRAICKHGLPDGNVYEFAAQQIQKYERKKRAKQLKAKAQEQILKAARRRQERSQTMEDN